MKEQRVLKKVLTSKVLESAAVAISIYRKDYLAANSTNAMLELGEYIEETTVHKSDDLLKELSKTKCWRGMDWSKSWWQNNWSFG